MNKKKCPQRTLSNGHKQANLPSSKKKKNKKTKKNNF